VDEIGTPAQLTQRPKKKKKEKKKKKKRGLSIKGGPRAQIQTCSKLGTCQSFALTGKKGKHPCGGEKRREGRGGHCGRIGLGREIPVMGGEEN